MSSITERQIDILNGLISTTRDSADGYGLAAKDARNSFFKQIFDARAIDRKQLISDLQAQVRVLGGEPKYDGSLLAAGHRLLLNLKSAVTGSDQSVIDEVETGEDYIKAKFEAALQDENLTPAIKAVIARGYQQLKADHDVIRDLKRDYQSQLAAKPAN